MKIGVLGVQGAVREHVRIIEELGEQAVVVRTREELAEVDGLILPGGESTAMRRLLERYGLLEELRASTIPMFGTCAGMILLATEIEGEDSHLNKIGMTVRRNAFGRQIDSFETKLAVKGIDHDVEAVFIRAPQVRRVNESVDVLAEVEEAIVAVREGNYLACSFHPELTKDYAMHRYFLNMVNAHRCEHTAV